MNVRVAILKVLSSYPDGRASYAQLKADLEILSTREWLARMRALTAHAGSIDIFRAGLATRDGDGWTITDAGREFIDRLERNDVQQHAEATGNPGLRVVYSKPPSSHLRSTLKQALRRLVRSA